MASLNSKYAGLHQSDNELKGKMVNIMNKKLILWLKRFSTFQTQMANGLTAVNTKYSTLHQSDNELKGEMVNLLHHS